MSRIEKVFSDNKRNLLNVYFTAGYPSLHDTGRIIAALSEAGVDIIEIGMPYSDPMADGTTIQGTNEVALKNGMTLDLLFEELDKIRKDIETPLILMGYLNQLMQYGEERFLSRCQDVGIDALIIPDLPPDLYEKEYRPVFEKYAIAKIFLITPNTSVERIHKIDLLSSGFIYVVSQSSITGSAGDITEEQKLYFDRIRSLKLKNPLMIGFGIHNSATFTAACSYAHGAIIGSAFLKHLSTLESSNMKEGINQFVSSIKK